MTVARNPYGYQSAEAFMLMKYASKKDGPGPDPIVERIWNSRDGVTPFMVRSNPALGPSWAGIELQHVEWQNDQYQPYWPHMRGGLKVGDRIFVDMTRERAEQIAGQVKERWIVRHGEYLAQRWAPLLVNVEPVIGPWKSDEQKRGYLVLTEHNWQAGEERLRDQIDETVAWPMEVPAEDDWDEIIESMVEGMLEPGAPDLVTVDEAMLERLRRHIPRPYVNVNLPKRFA